MPNFQIEIVEVLSAVIDIQAENLDEALYLAEKKYRDEEVVLTEVHHMTTDFRDYNKVKNDLTYTSSIYYPDE